MSAKLTTEEFVSKARQVHGDKYDYSKTIYVKSCDKVTIICPRHGEFEQQAASHLRGAGCPGCQREWSDEHRAAHASAVRQSRGMTTEEWVDRARVVHGDKYDYSRVEYVNQRTKVRIICRIHGEFEQNPDSHLRGCGCRKCGNMSDAHKGVHGWSDSQRAKIAATCEARYGATRYLDSAEGKKKNAEVRHTVEFRKKMHDLISSQAVQDKTVSTCLKKYGVAFSMRSPVIVDKVQETKRRNGTWNTSKPEEDMYVLLCQKFGAENVLRQYKDAERYPFRCDFYIAPLDLFIELNATWIHGGMWFQVSDAICQAKLREWEMQSAAGRKFYGVAIDVWTVRDVHKREAAAQNGLNYLVFWKNDLSDFKEWLGLEPLLLCNI